MVATSVTTTGVAVWESRAIRPTTLTVCPHADRTDSNWSIPG